MAKAKVAVVVDSTAAVPPELVAQYNLQVIPVILNWDGKSYRDQVDITADEFYRRLAASPSSPTTSQPSAGEFFEFFSQAAESAESIVAVLISEPLSGTLASARAAAEMMPDFPIEIVDSRSTSMGLGFMALAAARAVQAGADYHQAADAARSLVPHVRVIFVVDTLEYLHRGGRIGGAARLFGSMLSIKPLLHLEEGKVEPLARVRTKRKAVERMLQIATEEMEGKSRVHAAVLDALSSGDAGTIYEEVKHRLRPTELLRVGLSPVIGAHAGPGTVGVVYYAEPEA